MICSVFRSLVWLLPIIVSFSYIYVGQGNIAMQLSCGGIFNNRFIANCTHNVSVKNFENRLILGKNMNNDKLGRFWDPVYSHAWRVSAQAKFIYYMLFSRRTPFITVGKCTYKPSTFQHCQTVQKSARRSTSYRQRTYTPCPKNVPLCHCPYLRQKLTDLIKISGTFCNNYWQ